MIKIKKKGSNDKKAYGVLLKYFVTMLLIFAVPLTIITMMMYKKNIDISRDNIVDTYHTRLEETAKFIDVIVEDANYIIAAVTKDYYLNPVILNRDNASQLNGRLRLQDYINTSSSIDEIAYYVRGDDSVYSAISVHDIDTYINHYDIAIEPQKYYEILNSTNKEVITNIVRAEFSEKDNKSQYISIIYPVPRVSDNPYATLVFYIPVSKIIELMDEVNVNLSTSYFVLSADNEVLVSQKNTDCDIPDELVFKDQFGEWEEKIGSKKHTVFKTRSKKTGVSIVTITENDDFYLDLKPIKLNIILMFAAVLIAGMVIVYRTSRSYYQPIKQLKLLVKNNHDVTDFNANEMEYIIESTKNTIEKSVELSELVEKRNKYVANQMLEYLLEGNRSGDIDVVESLEKASIKFTNSHFCVCILQCKVKRIENQTKHEIMTLLSSICVNQSKVYAIELMNNQRIALICNLKDKNEASLNNIIEKSIYFYTQYDLNVAIGISEITDNLDAIDNCFIQANAALDYCAYHNHSSYNYFRNISKAVSIESLYPTKEILVLRQHIKQGDTDIAVDMVHKIFEQSAKLEVPVPIVKSICFEVVNNVIKTLYDLHFINKYLSDLDRIYQANSISSLERRIVRIITDVCSDINNRKENKNEKLARDIENYVKQIYMSEELSLDMLSEKYNLSIYFISRIFKDYVGMTFRDYIAKLRLEKARELISTTDMNIKQIVSMVGYYDESSFTRKFKKYFGVTPTQVRNNKL